MPDGTEHDRCVAATRGWCDAAEELLREAEPLARRSPRDAALYARARSLAGDLATYRDLAAQGQAMARLDADPARAQAAAERALQILVRAGETFGELQAVVEQAGWRK